MPEPLPTPLAADPLVRDRLEIPSDLAELARVRSFVRAGWPHVPAQALDEAGRDRWELAVVEAVTNVIRHSYQGRAGPVQLTSEVYPDRLTLSLRHRGRSFQPPPGADKALEEPGEGGMGLYLIRACTDGVRYSPEADGWSRIELTKRLGSTNHPGAPGAGPPGTPAT
jgi:anti-sigma regulatory factor (Ser/Thr protein kinase)